MFGFVSSARPQTLATPVFRLQAGSPEINFNSQTSFAVLSDFTGKDDVFLRSLLATLFNPPLFSTPTGDPSSFSNIRYTLSSSGMSNSTSSNISNSQIKKSQSWRT